MLCPKKVPTLWVCKSVVGKPRSLLKVNGKATQFTNLDLSDISGKAVIRKEFFQVTNRSFDDGYSVRAFPFGGGTQPVTLK